MQQPWAITLAALDAMVDGLRAFLAGGLKAGLFDGGAEPAADKATNASGIGVIPIRGALKQHQSNSLLDFFFGGASTESVSEQFRTFLHDDAVRAIVLDFDSPGGSAFGISELANEILAARGKKPILAFANSVAASGAYWIGAAADRLYSTPGGLVGSVGVYWMHEDFSKMADEIGLKVTYVSAGEHKTRGNEFEELTDDDIAHYQAMVDETYERMVNDIARGRGVSVADVKARYGQGDILTASQAKKAGMIDGIKTLADVIAEASTARPRPLKAVSSAEAEPPALESTGTIEPSEAEEQGVQRWARMKYNTFRAKAAVGAA